MIHQTTGFSPWHVWYLHNILKFSPWCCTCLYREKPSGGKIPQQIGQRANEGWTFSFPQGEQAKLSFSRRSLDILFSFDCWSCCRTNWIQGKSSGHLPSMKNLFRDSFKCFSFCFYRYFCYKWKCCVVLVKVKGLQFLQRRSVTRGNIHERFSSGKNSQWCKEMWVLKSCDHEIAKPH